MAPAPAEGLSVPALLDEAAARAGRPTGEVPFTGNLDLLVTAALETGRLSGTGLAVLRKVALRHLRNLLDLRAHLDADPERGVAPLREPLIVTGLPRTGTTLLHNLLALDPAHRVLRLWEALHPVPRGPDGPSPEVLQAKAEDWLDAFYRMVPEFRAIHPATATGPEECDALLQNTFASQHFDDMFDAHAYSAWLATAPLRDEYAHYALQLRVLSASSPAGTRWALKSPSHLGHLDALLGALPDATVVVCHRHPREAVSSYASLIFALRRPYGVDASPEVAGRQALDRTATAMRRAMEARRSAVDDSFVDVSYRKLAADPLGTVRAVYDRLGRRLEPDAEAPMARWFADNPRHKHGSHRYDLSRFGLTGAEVDAAFGPYLERFGIVAGA